MKVLRHSDFRNLWIAQATSTLGDRLVIVALALFVNDLTGSATDIGLVLAAHALPFVAFLLIGGVWADRLPRARLMIATDIGRGALHALLAILIFTGSVEIWHVIVIEALFGTVDAFFRPAFTGLMPRTVPEDEIQPAAALSNMTDTVAELTGPALATALVLGVGAGWAFMLDAATFAISAFFLMRVRTGAEPVPAGKRRPLRAELAEGFQHVRSRRWIIVTLAVFALAVPVGYAPLFVLGPELAEEGYDSAAFFGIVTALFGAGSVAGAIAGFRWRPAHPMRAAFCALTAWPVMLVSFGTIAPIAVVLVLALATGAGFALFDVWWDTALAQRIPADALSRVSSYDWMGSLILLPVGYLAAGPIAEATSAETVMVAGGVLTAVMLVVGLLPRETRMLGNVERS